MSRIDQMFSERGPTASFEFFPPKTGKPGTRCFGDQRVRAVAAFFRFGHLRRGRQHPGPHPRSGGAFTERDLPVANASLDRSWSHQSRDGIHLGAFAESGVDNILALRGDPPKAGDPGPEIFPHAIDLVRFIKSFNESGGIPMGALPLVSLDIPKAITKPQIF